MKITVLGSGGPIPEGDRAQSGLLVERASESLLVDCGSGVLLRLGELGLDLRKLEHILLTHCHLDHLSDLLPLLKARWLLGATKTTVCGPVGTRGLLSRLLALFPYLEEAITLDIVELGSGEEIKLAGISIETAEVVHFVPALAYKLDGKVVISGDTEPSPRIGEFAEGCELLFHECSLPDELALATPGHSSPSKLGEALAGRAIKALILVHLYPQASSKADINILVKRIQSNFSGEVRVAKDLESFVI